MFHSSKAITLSLKRYTDSTFIAKALSQKHGLLTFFVRVNKRQLPNIRNKFGLLNLVEINYQLKERADLSVLKEINQPNLNASQFNIYQNALKSYVAELVSLVLKEGDIQKELFSFLEKIVHLIENTHKDYIYVSVYFCVHFFDVLGVSIIENKTSLISFGITESEILFLESIQLNTTVFLHGQDNSYNLFELFNKLMEYFKQQFAFQKPIHSLEIFRTVFYD